MSKLSSILATLLFAGLLCVSASEAASKTPIKGKVQSGAGYHVVLIDGAGTTSLAKLPASGAFNLKAKKLKGATLTLLDTSGRALGPLVLSVKKGARKAYLGFSGKLPTNAKLINLGKINLKSGYGLPAKKVAAALLSKNSTLVANTDSSGNPEGAASGGISVTSLTRANKIRAQAEGEEGLSSPGSDSDADGIIDAIDPDVDGDGIVNIADPDFAGNDDATFSSLVLDSNASLNANIGSVTQEAIDTVIGGDYGFSIGFWFSLPTSSPITGGHVICADTNEYCNRSTGTAVYGGVTESDPALQGQLWRNLNADGSGYPNLEFLSVNGGDAITAAISPRLGTSAVRPGDTYLLNFTGASGGIQASKLLVLSPYMVTVPALKSYTADSVTTVADYSNRSTVVGTNSNPVVTDSSGLVTLTFWRPQRLLYRSETPSSESDRYRDMGHLKYGVTVEGGSRQFTCAGLYSGLTGGITETSGGLGTGDSPFANEGAELFPLRDSSDDATPSSESTISFTVDLHTCLTRASETIGTKRVMLVARGEDLSNGANMAAQQVYITVQ